MTYSLSILFTTSEQHKRLKENVFTTTYITISPTKDGATAKTKCINPNYNSNNPSSSFLPIKKLKVSSNLASILPKFKVYPNPRRGSSSSFYSSCDLQTNQTNRNSLKEKLWNNSLHLHTSRINTYHITSWSYLSNTLFSGFYQHSDTFPNLPYNVYRMSWWWPVAQIILYRLSLE